jgi:hypothetical protein
MGPPSLARLLRAQTLANKALTVTFPWAAAGITAALAWVAQKGPQGVEEADRLAKAGPVTLPAFDPCCVDMARFGMIPKWLDWEKDAAKLGEEDAKAAEAELSAPGGCTSPEPGPIRFVSDDGCGPQTLLRRPTTGGNSGVPSLPIVRNRTTQALPF